MQYADSLQPTFYNGVFTVYLQLLCETPYEYKNKRWIRHQKR